MRNDTGRADVMSGVDIPDRRDFLKWTGAGALALTLIPFSAEATPQDVRDAIIKLTGNKKFQDGRISITLPEIAENGSVVALTTSVESPMTADDYIKAIHVFADGNPLPDVATYRLGANNGKAEISFRLRLAKTQKVVVAAETNKGELFVTGRKVKVTLGGCGG